MAFQADIVHALANVLRRVGRPVEIRRVELDDLVAHLADGGDGAGQVLGEIAADGVEFKSDRDFLGRGASAAAANGSAAVMPRNARRERVLNGHGAKDIIG